jgi:hypothetical protein
MDRTLDAAADRQFLRDNIALDLRAIADFGSSPEHNDSDSG